MKKTISIFKSIIIIATVTACVSCKKEIERPQSDLNGSHKIIHDALVIPPVVMARTNPKTSTGYVGTGTLGDSTVVRK